MFSTHAGVTLREAKSSLLNIGVSRTRGGDPDSPVGVDKNTGETKNAMIVYSKTGSHIYPRKEDDK